MVPPLDPARRIRVARVITRLNIGGPAIQALLLHERLDPERFEARLLAGEVGPHEGDMRELRRFPGASADHRGGVIRIPGLRREVDLRHDVRAFAAILRELRAFRPDIVHTHLAKAGLLGRVAARVAGVPIVLHTYHGTVLQGYFDPVRSRAFLWLERLLGRLSTRIVAISETQAKQIAGFGIAPIGRIARVPLGLDLSPFLDAPPGALRRELGIDEATPLVGIVARLVPIKGVDLFLDAAADLGTRLPAVRFVVVGDGELRPDLEARARARGLNERLRFLGWRADLASIYPDLDVVVLSSRNEGFPVALIEALAAGRAVVATDVGGVSDLIAHERTGLLVGSGDVPGLARAIQRLLGDDGLRARLGEAGRARAFPAHDSSNLLANVERLYLDLATKGRSP